MIELEQHKWQYYMLNWKTGYKWCCFLYHFIVIHLCNAFPDLPNIEKKLAIDLQCCSTPSH